MNAYNLYTVIIPSLILPSVHHHDTICEWNIPQAPEFLEIPSDPQIQKKQLLGLSQLTALIELKHPIHCDAGACHSLYHQLHGAARARSALGPDPRLDWQIGRL